MIGNLKETTLKNTEQDWLKTNVARFTRMLQGQRDLLTVGRMVLSELAPVVSAQQGVLYILDGADDGPGLRLLASYAHQDHQALGVRLELGEGLVGQCAVDRRKLELRTVPPDYLKISSGLGQSSPVNLVVLPILFEGQVKGVLELASFERFNTMHHAFLDQLMESIGIVLHTIEANTRTEDLLKQSQSLAKELQVQQQELQGTNQQLEEKAKLLAEQNVEVERKNSEVEQARQALEEKAKQLALTSKYKSEFLANMSHELRTPLNSLLILSDQLSKNQDGNLTEKQTEFANTIHSAGNDLLTVGRLILSELAPVVSAQQGVFYTLDKDRRELQLLAGYATEGRKPVFTLGEGLIGQCAIENRQILLTSVPKDYMPIGSGLGEAAPLNVIVLPVVFEGEVKAVLELASFDRFNPTHLAFLLDVVETIGIAINTIQANTRTEDLLKQSQSLARELQ